MNAYTDHGFKTREDYLLELANKYALNLELVVRPISELLGKDEDFDVLVQILYIIDTEVDIATRYPVDQIAVSPAPIFED